jgi:hypothetical protein
MWLMNICGFPTIKSKLQLLQTLPIRVMLIIISEIFLLFCSNFNTMCQFDLK